jgi:anhydro-N-acetylmuramic acid kinase
MNDIIAIGLMSGTSMDGIDTTIMKTDGDIFNDYKYSFSFKYRKETLQLLSNLSEEINFKKFDQSLIEKANTSITYDHFFAINKILQKSNLKPDIIGFHGQTIYHNPEKRISIQLGNGNLLAKLTKTPVVFEFRKNDLLNNGQGAPLAPIYHKHLINKLQIPLPCCFINIGGVSNISYLDKIHLIGFDTGPGNGLIDLYMNKHFSKALDYNGIHASKGKANIEIIKKVLSNKFFNKNFPKSLDKLSFSSIFHDEEFLKLNKIDAICTLTELTVFSIIKSLDLLPQTPKNIVLMGGGQKNKYLVSKLKDNLNLNVWVADDFNIDGDMIEAQLIAYLATRKIRNLPSTFPSTTGANKPTVCGTIFNP